MRAFGTRRQLGVAVAVLASVLPVGSVGFAGFRGYELLNCTASERSALRQIPQLTAQPQEPGTADSGECSLAYNSDSTAEETLAHYRRQLGEKGWRIVKDEPNPQEPALREISAIKGSYQYEVVINGFPAAAPIDSWDVSIMVHR